VAFKTFLTRILTTVQEGRNDKDERLEKPPVRTLKAWPNRTAPWAKASEPFYRLIHHAPHIIFLANVSVNEGRFGSELMQFGFQGKTLLLTAARDDDPGTFPAESVGGCPSDTGEGTGNKDDRVFSCGFHWKF
jgi:hypothetical protein